MVHCYLVCEGYPDMRRWMCLVDKPNPAQSCGIISYRDPESLYLLTNTA
jgi:hypothetical protein